MVEGRLYSARCRFPLYRLNERNCVSDITFANPGDLLLMLTDCRVLYLGDVYFSESIAMDAMMRVHL